MACQYARMAKQSYEHRNESPAPLHYLVHKATIVEMRAPRTLRLAHNHIFVKTRRNETKSERERRRNIVNRNPKIPKRAYQARKARVNCALSYARETESAAKARTMMRAA